MSEQVGWRSARPGDLPSRNDAKLGNFLPQIGPILWSAQRLRSHLPLCFDGCSTLTARCQQVRSTEHDAYAILRATHGIAVRSTVFSDRFVESNYSSRPEGRGSSLACPNSLPAKFLAQTRGMRSSRTSSLRRGDDTPEQYLGEARRQDYSFPKCDGKDWARRHVGHHEKGWIG